MQKTPWASVDESDLTIRVETDRLEAVIPEDETPANWMTGIEKGSFLDKATGFREIGDGLMVVDWLMEAGSDEEYGDRVIAPDGEGVGRYSWYENETDPERRYYTRMSHGSSHRKRMVEGPQLCHRMKPVQPEVIQGADFIAVTTTYRFEYAAPRRRAGSRWTQRIVFPRGERFFVLMDRIDSVNDSPEMFLRGDMPGCVRHEKGDSVQRDLPQLPGRPRGSAHPLQRVLHPLSAGPEVRLSAGPERDAGALHPRLPSAGQADGRARSLAGGDDPRAIGGLRGLVQPAARRHHRHDRGDSRRAGEGG